MKKIYKLSLIVYALVVQLIDLSFIVIILDARPRQSFPWGFSLKRFVSVSVLWEFEFLAVGRLKQMVPLYVSFISMIRCCYFLTSFSLRGL